MDVSVGEFELVFCKMQFFSRKQNASRRTKYLSKRDIAARITYLGISTKHQASYSIFLGDSKLIQEVVFICMLDNSHSVHITIYTTLDQLDQEQYAVCLYWFTGPKTDLEIHCVFCLKASKLF